MFYSFDATKLTEAPGERDQEGCTVGAAARLALFDPDGLCGPDQGQGADGAGTTVEDLIEAYLRAKESSPGTCESYRTTGRKWSEWRNSHRSQTPMQANAITAGDLEDWLAWVYEQAVAGKDSNPGRTHNKRRQELQAVLTWAAKPGKTRVLASVPAFPEDREQRTVAGHYFLTHEELERLYWATYKLPRPRGWADARTVGALWRCALVLWRNYGLDTQILMPYTSRAVEFLTWGTVWTQDALPPGRVANCPNASGWIVVRRQKTGRDLFLPLEPVVRAHLDAIRPTAAKPEDLVLGEAGGSRPCERFQELCRLAGLTDKLDAQTRRPKAWELKDLRKTCATVHDANIPDSARYVLGHSAGTITERHYANTLPMVVRAVSTLPQPAAFRSILDASIKPPAGVLLFAK